MKLKQIEKMFPRSFRDENNQQLLYIYACDVGNNYFEYGEEIQPVHFYDKYQFLENDWRIYIITCDECFGCGSW